MSAPYLSFRALALAAALAIGVAPPADAASAPSPVHAHTLANGLRVYMVEDHKAPVVAVQVWYQVGSKDERPGLTGSSHLLEHMMFQGATTYGTGEFDRQLVKRGGQNNAFTTNDFTAYHETLASEHLDLALDLEADRMTGALIPPEKLTSEKEVVKEEMRGSSDNSPIGAAWDLLPSIAWLANGYHWPVGGWPSDIAAVKRPEILAYYKSYYAPNNAILVLVGDLDPAEALKLAERRFGPLKASPEIPRSPTKEPDYKGERRAVLLRDVSAPVVAAGYRVPAAGHADLPALRLLGAILGQGESSRLHQALVYRAGLAREVGAGVDEAKDGSLFWLSALGVPGKPVAKAEAALDAEVARIRKEGVKPAELAKVRASAESEAISERESAEGLAEAIGRRVSLGLSPDPDADLAKLRAVTAADVKRVAATWLARSGRAVVTVRAPGQEDR